MYICICLYAHISYYNISYNNITIVPLLSAYYALSTMFVMVILAHFVSCQYFEVGIVSSVLL